MLMSVEGQFKNGEDLMRLVRGFQQALPLVSPFTGWTAEIYTQMVNKTVDMEENLRRREVAPMGNWPYKTEKDLVAADYIFKNDSRCKGCDAMIEWWETKNGKMMPLDKETLQPHWGTCPKASRFKE